MKETIRDLEDVRNASGEVRSFRHVHGHIKGAEDYSNHPEGCTCGHCGKDHDHTSMGHIPKHSHGAGCNHHHEHKHVEHDDCCCGNNQHNEHEHHGHEDECGCGSDHHEQEDECDCSHEHGAKRKRRGPQIGCGCCDDGDDGHDHDHDHGDHVLWELVIGGVVFIVTEWLGVVPDAYHIYCLIFAYILLGGRIVLTALKNILKGNVFDENFLMTVATLGAFAIQAWEEAVGVMFFYRVGEYFEQRAVEKSRGQIMDAVDMRPEVVNLVSGEEILVVPAEDAKQGDIVMVRPGDRIPLDGTIVDGESRIDTSAVTGEPVPVSVKTGDEVISGCVNTSGLLKVRVDKVLSESMVSRILDSVENAAASKPKMERFITKFARVYTPVVVAVALGTAILPSLITGDWSKWVYTALTFLVISCPCALVLSVPLAFFSGIGAGSKKGILFKGGLSLEAMSRIKAIVMDKTGTITEGNFVVQYVNAVDGHESDELLALAASCELGSTHPIGESIVAAAKNNNLELHRQESVEEISGKGIRAVIDGKEVLCGNYQLLESYHVKRNAAKKEIMGSEVLVACDGKYLGNLVIDDTVKVDAVDAIAAIKKQGIATVMLTGDAVASAKAGAAETGSEEYYAKLLPVDKVNKLKSIRKKYGPVMFVGDGINDAPVLAGADVGAAMGSGADAAIEAADVVFMTSSVEAIPQSMKIARNVNQIAVQNVVFALVIKALVMILGLFGYANMWMAVFADTGVAMLCVLNSIRVLYSRKS